MGKQDGQVTDFSITDKYGREIRALEEAEQKIQQYMSVLVKTREDREELIKRSSDRIRI